MNIIEMNGQQWETKMENLLCEIKSSKEAYVKLSEQLKYPERKSFFKQQAAQRLDFEKVFEDELTTVEEGFVKDCKDRHPIFDAVANTVADGNLSVIALDRLILQKEQDLIEKYQEVLAYPDIPDATAAILQAQAEDMNNTVLKLRVDLNLEEKGYGPRF